MTEHAKKAAFEVAVYEEECHLEGRRLSRSKIIALIDTEFAEVVKEAEERDAYEARLLTAQKQRETALTECDVIREERDDLKDALRELRRAVLQHGIVVAECRLRLSNLTTAQISAALQPVAEDFATALAAANEKLLEEHQN